MPQDKFITRKKAGVFEQMDSVTGAGTDTRKSRQVINMAEQKAKEKAYDNLMKAKSVPAEQRDPSSVGRAEAALKRAQSGVDADARGSRSVADTVARRDATNARVARERLQSRAESVKAQPGSGGNFVNNLNEVGSIVGVADAIYQADKATDFKRTKYSGNFGGPSFNVNPYSSKASYPGQSKVSMLMGVGKKGK